MLAIFVTYKGKTKTSKTRTSTRSTYNDMQHTVWNYTL